MTPITIFVEDSATVPEPGALALFGIGLVGLFAVRRRRKALNTTASSTIGIF